MKDYTKIHTELSKKYNLSIDAVQYLRVFHGQKHPRHRNEVIDYLYKRIQSIKDEIKILTIHIEEKHPLKRCKPNCIKVRKEQLSHTTDTRHLRQSILHFLQNTTDDIYRDIVAAPTRD